jgi:large subunit ribosomal protein L1
MKRGKRYKEIKAKVEQKEYLFPEAISILKNTTKVKFDETAEITIQLGIDPRKSDQMVRGTVFLPHGTGKKIRILVFAIGDQEKEAQEAGADFVGGDELVEKIEKGWTDFDLAIAVPEMMAKVGKIGKVLGPKGLMPNPKVGTVTKNVTKAISDARKGRVEFKSDKTANLHIPIGKLSFTAESLEENFLEVIREIMKLRPSSSKGTYVKNIFVSSTMGPSIRLNAQETVKSLRK